MSDQSVLDKFARDYAEGTVLFREGEDGDSMYVVQDGEVEIRRTIGGCERVLAVLAAGEFLGEMAVVNDRPRTATAVVKSPARLLVISAATFEAMIRSRAEIAVRIIKALASRLERANQQIELLLVRDANHRVVHFLRRLAEEQAQEVGIRVLDGAVHINMELGELASRIALSAHQTGDALERLRAARLVVPAREAGVEHNGYVIPEVGRLLEFLEFLELRDRRQ